MGGGFLCLLLNKVVSEILLFERLIAESDSDMEIGSSITAGFNDEKDFVIELDPWDYAKCGYNNRYLAIVDKDDALLLADKLRVKLTALPQVMQDKFGVFSDIMVPSEIDVIYKEILDFILRYNVKYKLVRKNKR